MSLTDEDRALKPCPFCGCDAWVVEDRDGPLLYRPQCKMCGASRGGYQYLDNAISGWNAREQPRQPLEDVREKVARTICYWSEPSTCHDQYCSTRCTAVKPDAWCWKAAAAILALPAVAVGDGWRAVPVEPTEEMTWAARGLLMAIQMGVPNYSTSLGDVADSGFYGEAWAHILTDEERTIRRPLTKEHRAQLIYRAMIQAAPPHGGGG